jgi:hypothetical protein
MSVCVSVALGIQHAMLTRHIVISGLACPAPQYFYYLARYSKINKLDIKRVSLHFLYNFCLETFSLLEEMGEI